MIGLLLLILIAAYASWYAWLYLVSPASDQDRIRADQAGTGCEVIKIERTGAQRDRAGLTWVAGWPTYFTGGRWFRIYEVTIARPDGLSESYPVGIEARLLGLPELKRIDWRA